MLTKRSSPFPLFKVETQTFQVLRQYQFASTVTPVSRSGELNPNQFSVEFLHFPFEIHPNWRFVHSFTYCLPHPFRLSMTAFFDGFINLLGNFRKNSYRLQ